MILMCVECGETYDDPKPRFVKGAYGVCKKCATEATKETPNLLREEFKKIFEHEPTMKEVLELISAGIKELSFVAPTKEPLCRVLMCTECWELYDDPKPRFETGSYGVCKKCADEAVKETPNLLRKELGEIFEQKPSAKKVLELIKAGLRQLAFVTPRGQPQREAPKRPPGSRRIMDLGLGNNRHDNGHRKE